MSYRFVFLVFGELLALLRLVADIRSRRWSRKWQCPLSENVSRSGPTRSALVWTS